MFLSNSPFILFFLSVFSTSKIVKYCDRVVVSGSTAVEGWYDKLTGWS